MEPNMIPVDALTVSLVTLAGVRLLGMIVFFDLWVKQREPKHFILMSGMLLVTIGSAWGLYTHLAWDAMEHQLFSLLSGLGTFWIGCGILAYFKDLEDNFATIGRRFVVGVSLLIIVYGLLPLVGVNLGPAPGVFVQLFIVLIVIYASIFKRRTFIHLAPSSYTWLVILAVLWYGLTLAFIMDVFGPDGLALGFAGTTVVQFVAIIFFLHLEFNLAHRQLKDSQQRFMRLAENAQDLIYRYEFTPQPGFTYVSPAATEITGYTPEEHYADPELGYKLVHPEDRPLLEAVSAGKFRKGQSLTLRWVKKDGSIIWCEQRNVPIYDDSGALIALEGIARDITAERQASRQYRQLFQQMQEGVALHEIILDDQGAPINYRYISVNPAFERLTGLAAEDVIGRTVLDVLPGTEPYWIETFGKVALTGEPLRVTNYTRELDKTVEVSAFQPAPQHFVAIIKDITEEKRAQDALRHSHDLLRYIIEHNKSAVAVHDRDLNYIYVSQRYLDNYRVQDQNIIGKHHYEVFPDLPQKWREVHQKALAGETLSAEDDIYKRADGSVEYTRWECRPWYQADGTIGGIIVYTEIITERKQVEEELRQLKQNLEHQVAEKTAALQEKIQQLEHFRDVTVEREFRMKELREEIKRLKGNH
jgi:PAS domain S-box-containing protein